MPFNYTSYSWMYGLHPALQYNANRYCQNNTAASDYGKCYNPYPNTKFIFVQTDTTTWPTLPCESDGTCIRYTATVSARSFGTVFSYAGKQAIITRVIIISHSSRQINRNVIEILYNTIQPFSGPYGLYLPEYWYGSVSDPIYSPVSNLMVHRSPYSLPSGYTFYLSWSGNVFATSVGLYSYEENVNNIWYGTGGIIYWAYESSPLAVIPLDYDRDYVSYQELRNTFGFSTNGVDQPGWNADDIIRVLRELFSNRAWAVFDDRQYVLYLYNLTPDYVPDWLIEKLSPTAMKVIQSPADAAVAKAWLDLLNERNAQIPPQTELP